MLLLTYIECCCKVLLSPLYLVVKVWEGVKDNHCHGENNNP